MNKILPKPFLGRLLLQAMEDDVEAYMKEKAGLSKNSLIQLPENYKEKHRIAVKKGRIVDMAPDAYGEAFQRKYGTDIQTKPTIGDVVYYIPGQSYKVDLDEKYHLIADEDIMAFEPYTEETQTLKTEA